MADTKPLHQLILDVETQKTFDQVGGYFPEKLGISFVGAIERIGLPETGIITEKRHQFFESDLAQLWPLLEQVDVIIGYNILGFDLPTFKTYYHGDITRLPSLDLMEVIKNSAGHRVSLDAVASLTLGTKKIGNGLDAIRYYENRELDKLAKYCMKDVEITRDIYDFGRTHGKVKFLNKWNSPVEVPVNFVYDAAADLGLQMTLV